MVKIEGTNYSVDTMSTVDRTEATLKNNHAIVVRRKGNLIDIVDGKNRIQLFYPEGKPPAECRLLTYSSESEAVASLDNALIRPVSEDTI
jgi:hypothetical protein